MANITEQTIKNYPFLSLVKYGGSEYIGIIQNFDDTVMSIYEYSRVTSENMRLRFLELGENWWYESNRQVPINLFLKEEWIFTDTLVNLNSKDSEVTFGPSVSINELAKKRTKRRNIQLVKKVK
jgi:hypothetical protein|tara:strand:+ start:94 stop:465 length:372 start_codon:yes stop_codon:yes gene_type:complete